MGLVLFGSVWFVLLNSNFHSNEKKKGRKKERESERKRSRHSRGGLVLSIEYVCTTCIYLFYDFANSAESIWAVVIFAFMLFL